MEFVGMALMALGGIGSLVFGISAQDPATFVGVPVILGLVALVANYIPARRATRTDPVTALRTD